MFRMARSAPNQQLILFEGGKDHEWLILNECAKTSYLGVLTYCA